MQRKVKREDDDTDTSHDAHLFALTDWRAAGVTSFVALAIYFFTLAPTVTLEQSGAFVVAGQYLGIGRVPGYPVWHLLAKLFISVFGFVRYRGCPNPAWATNFLSAFFGALSCGLVALLVCRVGRALCFQSEGRKEKATVAAIVAGILFAISRTMWSQSVITETHTLTLFFILLFLVASLVWLNRPSRQMACVVAAIFGIGLAQSHIFVLLIPSLLLAVFFISRGLLRDFLVTAIPVFAALHVFLLQDYPNIWVGIGVVSGIILFLCLSFRFLPQGFTASAMLLLIILGLLLYVYLPFASLGNPPMQFGYPQTWAGFKFVITRGQYERMLPTDVFGNPSVFLDQLRWYAMLLNQQFILLLGFAGFLPLIRISCFRGPWLKWWFLCLLTFFMCSVIFLIGANPYCDIQDTFIQRVKFIPSFAMWGIFTGFGLLMIFTGLDGKTAQKQEMLQSEGGQLPSESKR